MTAKPRSFELHIPDADIADLKERLARSRFADSAPGEPWAYGTDVSYLSELTEYWRTKFDWRAQEAALNAFPQFRVALDDIDLHYLHVPGVGPDPLPLLLLHGWPGSVFEFLEIIPRLSDPARFGGDEFALLLWNLSATDARAKAAALEETVDQLRFVFRGQKISAGASAGVAMLGPHAEAGRALEEADSAMYVRKAQRRHEDHAQGAGS